MKKIYGSTLRMSLFVSDRVVDFHLHQQNAVYQNQFQTEDAKLQSALEKLPSFGKSFYLLETVEDKEPKEPKLPKQPKEPKLPKQPKEPKSDTSSITDVQDAITWLIENCGVDATTFHNIEDVKSACLEHGVVFDNVTEFL